MTTGIGIVVEITCSDLGVPIYDSLCVSGGGGVIIGVVMFSWKVGRLLINISLFCLVLTLVSEMQALEIFRLVCLGYNFHS
jgi:hypothetical protein